MKNNKLFLTIFIALLFCLSAKAQNVSNIKMVQDGEIVVILYDLSKDADIEIQVSTDDGINFTPLTYTTGNVGKNVTEGKEKRINWHVVTEMGYIDNPNIRFKIIDTPINQTQKETAPVNAYTDNEPIKKSSYRTFFDINYGYLSSLDFNIINISTTHGCQLNNNWFLGGGLNLSVGDNTAIDVFFKSKINFTRKQIAPFFDIKIGYGFGDAKGFLIEQKLGLTFFSKHKDFGFSLYLGGTVQNIYYERKESHYDYNYGYSYNYYEYDYEYMFIPKIGIAIEFGRALN